MKTGLDSFIMLSTLISWLKADSAIVVLPLEPNTQNQTTAVNWRKVAVSGSARDERLTMTYDFTSIMDRHGKDAIAVDGLGAEPGFAPDPPKEGFDVIPMWVADMNFPTVPTLSLIHI